MLKKLIKQCIESESFEWARYWCKNEMKINCTSGRQRNWNNRMKGILWICVIPMKHYWKKRMKENSPSQRDTYETLERKTILRVREIINGTKAWKWILRVRELAVETREGQWILRCTWYWYESFLFNFFFLRTYQGITLQSLWEPEEQKNISSNSNPVLQ